MRDVDEISKILKAEIPSESQLFNIVLRRSGVHIMNVDFHYRSKCWPARSLVDELRHCATMPKLARDVAVQAVRSATDPTYRDVMALKDVIESKWMDRKAMTETLATRICRMHWYKQHWGQVKALVERVHAVWTRTFNSDAQCPSENVVGSCGIKDFGHSSSSRGSLLLNLEQQESYDLGATTDENVDKDILVASFEYLEEP